MTTPSLAVVGAGAAGQAAARAMVGAGITVHLFDRLPIEVEQPLPGIVLHPDTPVWALFPGWHVCGSQDLKPVLVDVDAVLLACGTIDRTVPFAGSTKPGVMTASGLTNLTERWGLLPGDRFVVIGDGPDGAACIEYIQRAGGEVVLIESLDAARTLEVLGKTGVTGVRKSGKVVPADVVVIAAGFLPDLTLAAMAGCDMSFDHSAQCWRLALTDDGQTSIPSIWAAGSLAGATDASRSGKRAADSIISSLTGVTALRDGVRNADQSAIRQPWKPDEQVGAEFRS